MIARLYDVILGPELIVCSTGWQGEGENMGAVEEGERGGDEEVWRGARVFVATTTSGLAAGMRPHEKEEVWRVLWRWVEKRRRERDILD